MPPVWNSRDEYLLPIQRSRGVTASDSSRMVTNSITNDSSCTIEMNTSCACDGRDVSASRDSRDEESLLQPIRVLRYRAMAATNSATPVASPGLAAEGRPGGGALPMCWREMTPPVILLLWKENRSNYK